MSDQDAKKKIIEKLLQEIRASETSTLNFVVPNFLSKTLRSYMLIREDLIYATRLIEHLIELKRIGKRDDLVETSLWQSSVTTYAKNFTQNKAGMIKLEDKDCFKDAPSSYIEIHGKMMELRHSFFAHRDDTEHEQSIVYLKLPKSGPIPEQSEYRIRALKLSSPNINELKGYLDVFNYLKKYVENKIQIAAEKVHKSLMNELSADELKHLLI